MFTIFELTVSICVIIFVILSCIIYCANARSKRKELEFEDDSLYKEALKEVDDFLDESGEYLKTKIKVLSDPMYDEPYCSTETVYRSCGCLKETALEYARKYVPLGPDFKYIWSKRNVIEFHKTFQVAK